MRKLIIIALGCVLLVGCVTAPPRNPGNVCSIFYQYPKWYWQAKKVQKRWGMPVYVQMAFIYQESRFHAKAKPPHSRILFVIPWFTRVSSSYGYTQALKGTWQLYKRDSGNHGAKRSRFADAVDFVGWFGHTAHRKLGIPYNNAYALYLAYHEGIGGYARRSYLRKPWLIHVAHKVSYRSHLYQRQLWGCADKIPKQHWWSFLF